TRYQEEHGEALEDQQQEEEQQQEEQQQWSRAGGKQSRDWSERKRVEDQHWTALNGACGARTSAMHHRWRSATPTSACWCKAASSLQWMLLGPATHAGACQQESLQPRDSLPVEYVNMKYRASPTPPPSSPAPPPPSPAPPPPSPAPPPPSRAPSQPSPTPSQPYPTPSQ
ncbi:hypothetical protein QJQ45_028376, partial [Haematococcus lacustris]